MLNQFLLCGLIFISFFGLISCKSDGGTVIVDEIVEGPAPVELSIDELGGGITDAADLNLGHHFRLSTSSNLIEKVGVTSLCQTAGDDELNHYLEFTKSNQFQLRDLVPQALLTAASNVESFPKCRFQFNIVHTNGATETLSTADLEIKDIDQYTDFAWDLLKKDSMAYINYRDLDDVFTIKNVPNNSSVKLICEAGETTSIQYKKPIFDNEALFAPELFEDEGAQRCRIVVTKPESHKRLTSKVFFLQYHLVRLDSHLKEYDFADSPTFDYRNDRLYTLTVPNQSKAMTYVKMKKNPRTRLFVESIFLYQRVGHRQPLHPMDAYWDIESPAKAIEFNKNEVLYQLKPGEELNISLVAKGRRNCPRKQGTTSSVTSMKCDFIHIFAANAYYFSPPPALQYSRVSRYNHKSWSEVVNRDRKLIESHPRYKHLSYFYAPNTLDVAGCPVTPKAKVRVKDIGSTLPKNICD